MKQTLTSLCMLLTLLYWSLAGAETRVWRSTDESGTVVFSDEPRPGATAIEVEAPQVYSAPVVSAGAPQDGDAERDGGDYRSLELVQPEPGATVWDNQGNLWVRYAAEPRLRAARGHRLVVLLDGAPGEPVAGSEYRFEGLDRGAHLLQARIVGGNGEVLIESQPATLYLQQQSLNYPARGDARQPRPPGVVPPTRPPSPPPSATPEARSAMPGP